MPFVSKLWHALLSHSEKGSKYPVLHICTPYLKEALQKTPIIEFRQLSANSQLCQLTSVNLCLETIDVTDLADNEKAKENLNVITLNNENCHER